MITADPTVPHAMVVDVMATPGSTKLQQKRSTFKPCCHGRQHGGLREFPVVKTAVGHCSFSD
jgi:hypothetical protein